MDSPSSASPAPVEDPATTSDARVHDASDDASIAEGARLDDTPAREGAAAAGVGAGAEAMEARHHVLVQATVPALDVDGRTAALVGTLLFVIATGAVAVYDDRRRTAGVEWGLWTAVAGIGLGLFMLAYCELRRWLAADRAPVVAVPEPGAPPA